MVFSSFIEVAASRRSAWNACLKIGKTATPSGFSFLIDYVRRRRRCRHAFTFLA